MEWLAEEEYGENERVRIVVPSVASEQPRTGAGKPVSTAKLVGGYADVFCDLPQQHGSDIAPFVHGDSRTTSIGMTVLDMRTALTNHNESQSFEPGTDFLRFQNFHGHPSRFRQTPNSGCRQIPLRERGRRPRAAWQSPPADYRAVRQGSPPANGLPEIRGRIRPKNPSPCPARSLPESSHSYEHDNTT